MNSAVRRYSPTHFPAPVARRRVAGQFVLSETLYGSGAALPTHAHAYACVVVAFDGTFQERRETKTRTVEPGTIIVRPEGEPHSNRFGRGGGRCLNVELHPAWLALNRDVVVRSTTAHGGRMWMLGRRLHRELVDGDDVSAVAVESVVLGMLAGFHRGERRAVGAAPPWLLRVRDRICDDPTAGLALADLADEAGVHPVHLAASFRRFFGRSVAATIRQLRLELACRALSCSDDSIADVAIGAGFADQSHLGRALMRAKRMTPADYRAASRRVPAP
jgi:AraC family transcriptional regulator